MPLRRFLVLSGGLCASLLAAPQCLAAQGIVFYTYFTNATDLAACRGFTSIHRASWSKDDPKDDNLNVSYPVVAEVDRLAPAGKAGLLNGDSLVKVNRFSTLGTRDPELSLWNLQPGDFNRIEIKRGAKAMEVIFHMGVWEKAPGDSMVVDPVTGRTNPHRLCRPGK